MTREAIRGRNVRRERDNTARGNVDFVAPTAEEKTTNQPKISKLRSLMKGGRATNFVIFVSSLRWLAERKYKS